MPEVAPDQMSARRLLVLDQIATFRKYQLMSAAPRLHPTTKYMELVQDRPEWLKAMDDLKNVQADCLKPVAQAFHSNMLRIAMFGHMPMEIIFQRGRDLIHQCNAFFRVTGIGERSVLQVFEGVAVPGEIDEFKRQCVEFERRPQAETDIIRRRSVWIMDEMAACSSDALTSIHALYTSQILEAWLFFEALCADLWAAGVDNGGRTITAHVTSHTAWEKTEIKPSDTDLYEANPRTHPGSYRRETGMVTFQKRRNIEGYYAVAFGPEIKKVFDDSSNGDIWTLNAFRNCITHYAGKVDVGFKRQVAHSAEFRDLPLKSPLCYDGALCSRLRNAALITGTALIQKVDEMLQRGD